MSDDSPAREGHARSVSQLLDISLKIEESVIAHKRRRRAARFRFLFLVLAVLLIWAAFKLIPLAAAYWYTFYLLVGGAIFLVTVLAPVRQLLSVYGSGPDRIAALRPRTATRLERVRSLIARLAAAASAGLIWPAVLVVGPLAALVASRSKNRDLSHMAALRVLYPVELFGGAALLAISLLFLGLEIWIPALASPVRRLLPLLAIGQLAALVSTVIGTDLPTQMRAGRMQPWVRCALNSVLSFATLAIVLTGHPDAAKPAAWGAVVDTGRAILEARELSMAHLDFHTWINQSSLATFTLLAGVLWYTAVGGALLTAGEFVRRPDDYITVCRSFLLHGRYDDAERWFVRVKSLDANSITLRAVIALARGDIERGLTDFETVLKMRGEPFLRCDVFFQALGAALQHRLLGPASSLVSTFARTGGSDMEAARLVGMYRGIQLDEGQDEIGRMLPSIRDDYHLTRATILLSLGKFSEAEALLAGAAIEEPNAALLRRYLLLEAQYPLLWGWDVPGTAQGIQRRIVEAWVEEHLTSMLDSLGRLEQDRERAAASMLMVNTALLLDSANQPATFAGDAVAGFKPDTTRLGVASKTVMDKVTLVVSSLTDEQAKRQLAEAFEAISSLFSGRTRVAVAAFRSIGTAAAAFNKPAT